MATDAATNTATAPTRLNSSVLRSIVGGLAIGAWSGIAPMYIAELAAGDSFWRPCLMSPDGARRVRT